MAFLGILAFIIELLLFGFLIVLFSSNIQNKKYQSKKTKNQTIFYELNPSSDHNLTEEQSKVVEFLFTHEVASLYDILREADADEELVRKLASHGVIREVKKQELNMPSWLTFAAPVLIALIFFAANYIWMFKTNVRYLGIVYYVAIFLIASFIVIDYIRKFDDHIRQKFYTIVVGFVVVLTVFYGLFGGRVYLHADEYAALIDVQDNVFSDDVNTVNVDSLPIVDKAYGAKLGSLKMGEYPALGSEFEPGRYSDILYQGEQYLVAPLEYRGIFKYINNRKEGTPGYILINKVTAETELVNLIADGEKGLKYIESSYFNTNLTRHAYYNGMSRYQLEETYFEIDESGHPFYVMQYSLPTIFINGGANIAKIAVVDAVSGEVSIYDPLEVPDWVESVYNPSIFVKHLNYYGALQDGWLNSIFAQRGVLTSSRGTRTVLKDGRLHVFTGLTSAGSDESTIGFVYMDTKTKETTLYKFPGATESAAMNKVLTLLPQNNISTSSPIPVNVEGIPTYYILIKGEDGRILRHVYMNVQDLEVWGMSETKRGAYNDYLRRLGETDESALTEITGVIQTMTSYVNEGNTIYWIEIDDVFYVLDVSNFDIPDMQYFIVKQEGDTISFLAQNTIIVDLLP
jgi:hypothetical protein